MKRTWIVMLLSLCILLSSCTLFHEPAKTYIIPNSYWAYISMTPEEAQSIFHRLGSDYYTDVKTTEDGIEVQLTRKQRDRLIRRGNDQIADIIEQFKAQNSDYRYIPDETYQTLSFYFDENIPPMIHLQTVCNTASIYALNYMLEHNTSQWSVAVNLYKSHTNKLVVSINIPQETVSYGPEEWAKSYEN